MNLQQHEKKTKREAAEEVSSLMSEPRWLLEKRLEAVENFSTLPVPDFAYGLGISLDAGGLDLESLEAPAQPKPITTTHGSEGVFVSDLHEALKTHENLIRQHIFKTLDGGAGKIQSLNQALFTRGLFVHVPKGVEAHIPVHADFLLQSNTLEHVLIMLEPFSRLVFLETGSQSCPGSATFRSQTVEVFSGEGSSLDFGCIQNFSHGTFNFSDRRAILGKDSKINWNICDFGGRMTQSHVTNALEGQGAAAKNIGIFFGRDTQQFDFSVSAIHKAPNTECEMLTKGALDGKSKAIYRGLIKISQSAPKSQGYQKADIILLSSGAEADPIPNLEIDNNDITKCTHGATVGQIDRDKVFYMMSRGLTEAEAKKKIVEGLFEPAVSRIPVESVQNRLRGLLDAIICQG